MASYQEDVIASHTLMQGEKRAAGTSQSAHTTADINHYTRLYAATKAWPGNSNSALITLRALAVWVS
jgi:hypothetical protein